MRLSTTRSHRARVPVVFVAAVVLSLLASACVGRAGDEIARPDGSRPGRGTFVAPDWENCPDDPALDGLECATVPVPLDHADPGGDTIDIALARLVAGDPDRRIGSLFVNPGGPGSSGVEFVNQLATGMEPAVLDRFDVVGFDPRGVGRSAAVRCIEEPDAFVALDGDPDNPVEVNALLDANAEIAATCIERHGNLLPHLTTAATARDLDLLRAAVGDDALTYLGFSYGTQLGAVYASLFPDRVRALVLDGAVALDLSEEEMTLTQAQGFEQAFTSFARACTTDPACAAHPDALATFDRVNAAVEQDPIPVSTPGESRRLSTGAFQYGVAGALYDQALWGLLATALVQADNGDGGALLSLSDLYHQRQPDGTFPNLADAFRAIRCADSPNRVEPDDAVATATATAGTDGFGDASRFGDVFAWSMLSCVGWPLGAEPQGNVVAPEAPAVLVVGTTGDPATPYDWAERLTASLAPNAVLLTYEGEGHTAYLSSACVRSVVDAYLIDAQLPPDVATCTAQAEETGSPFEGLAADLEEALSDAGLPEDVVACIADRVAAAMTPADLVAANSGELPEEMQQLLTGAATECARGG